MKTIHRIKIALFLLIIFGGPILLVAKYSPKQYLVYENKSKTRFPKNASVMDGKFMKGLEGFVEDNFPFRENALALKTGLDLGLGRPKISDVVVSKDGDRLLDHLETAEDKKQVDVSAMAKLKEELAKRGVQLVVVGVPRQSAMLSQEYPSFLENGETKYQARRKAFFSQLKDQGIPAIDLHEKFQADPKAYYFKTDHHYNFQGALLAYAEVCKLAKQAGLPMEDLRSQMKITTKPKAMMGSANRKLFGVFSKNEDLTFAEPKTPIAFQRWDRKRGSKELKKQQSRINSRSRFYATYMGGDLPETIIETKRPNLMDIMVLGDSTSNPLESLLWMNADRFVSLDFRYYKDKDLLAYIDEQPTDLLVVTIISDNYNNLERVMGPMN